MKRATLFLLGSLMLGIHGLSNSDDIVSFGIDGNLHALVRQQADWHNRTNYRDQLSL